MSVTLPPIEHHVVWDAELAATCAGVVGSILEWRGKTPEAAVDATLQAIVDFYRLKNALNPSKPAAGDATKYAGAQQRIRDGEGAEPEGGEGTTGARAGRDLAGR